MNNPNFSVTISTYSSRAEKQNRVENILFMLHYKARDSDGCQSRFCRDSAGGSSSVTPARRLPWGSLLSCWAAHSSPRLPLPPRLSSLAAYSWWLRPLKAEQHLIGRCGWTLPHGSVEWFGSVSCWGSHRGLRLVSAGFWLTAEKQGGIQVGILSPRIGWKTSINEVIRFFWCLFH